MHTLQKFKAKFFRGHVHNNCEKWLSIEHDIMVYLDIFLASHVSHVLVKK